MDDELLEPADVSRQVKRPENWLAKLRVIGGGPKFLKIGGKIRYRRSDVEAWLARCEHASTATTKAA
jgi:hypothetical protein